MALSRRKHPVHGVYQPDSSSAIIYLTVCARDRRPWLANELVHQQLRVTWMEATRWRVGKYMIMPDHIHLFAAETEELYDFDTWVRYWKRQFSILHGNPAERFQTDHWDTRMRSVDHYSRKWDYVRWNPVRHGLVTDPDDWLFQGEIFRLEW
jgi:putative transposase